MKKQLFFGVLLIISALYLGACDSPTDSKATSVNAPVLVSPEDNATGIALTPLFKWSGSADKIIYATNSNFNNAVTISVNGTEFRLNTSLSPNTTYFWKAGITSGSSTLWSASYWRFTTGN